MVQPDLKRLASYASVSHLGFVMLGIFALTPQSVHGRDGRDAQPRHLDGRALPARRHAAGPPRHGDDPRFGGLARVVPMLGVFLVLVTLSTVGLPRTNGFVGEFLVLLGRSARIRWPRRGHGGRHPRGRVPAPRVQRVLFEPLADDANRALPDLDRRELTRDDGVRRRDRLARRRAGPGAPRMEGPIQRLIAQVQRGSEAAPEVAAAPRPPR
jgi:NADH-quinone oxidoreductase subunit M